MSTVDFLKIIQKVVINDTNRYMNLVYVYDMQATTFFVKQREKQTHNTMKVKQHETQHINI